MIATDMLAQAEHDVRTRVGLITTDADLAKAVEAEVERQLQDLSTAETAAPPGVTMVRLPFARTRPR